jgi:hypothetical protein
VISRGFLLPFDPSEMVEISNISTKESICSKY